ncbi:MAG: U32 family peptidase [Lachnospiraceae bacterium]|nr:U32 family peptidase [Lachnospiraceae bacterium]
MGSKLRTVELLSPAGDMDCFLAALCAGADAVYLGLNRFSARASAANFSEDELIRALDMAHLRGVKVYLTVNTLFKDSEMCDLYDLLYRPYINGLDAVIVQDIGVMKMIKTMFPDLSLHASTQAAVTATEGVRLLQDLGVKRVVPARELSLAEIKKIIADTGMSIECFIHGSLCYSYSGKCLMSSFIGGRSGNRGRCAQPCRLRYDDSYLLSLKDLCVIDIIPELIGAGIASFKIEGRMKSAGYVYGTTSVYRKYIDMYYEGGYSVDPADRKRLISYYTRGGSCDGYYHRHNGKDMITYGSPSYSTDDTGFDKALTSSLKIPVNISCSINRGRSISVRVYNDDASVTADTGIICEDAVSHSLSADDVATQLKKSGNSAFLVVDTDVNVEDGLFLTKKDMNSIRRTGLEKFSETLLEDHRKELPYAPPSITDSTAGPDENLNVSRKIHVSVSTFEQLLAALESECDAVIIPTYMLDSVCAGAVDLSAKDIYIRLPVVIRDDKRMNSSGKVKDIIQNSLRTLDIKGAYISNLESILILKDIGFSGRIIGDQFLYAFNRQAHDVLASYGVTTTVPVELNEWELKHRNIKGEDLIVYGRIPLMVSANCVYNSKYGCDRTKGHSMYLSDRKSMKPYVHCICDECTNIIYNSTRTCITDEESLIRSLYPSSLCFIFTDESRKETSDLLKRYSDTRHDGGYTGSVLIDDHTRGHLKRGVD